MKIVFYDELLLMKYFNDRIKGNGLNKVYEMLKSKLNLSLYLLLKQLLVLLKEIIFEYIEMLLGIVWNIKFIFFNILLNFGKV